MKIDSNVSTGRRERKRLETRESLIRAALDLFSVRGFDAVTVIEIAEQADVDPSTFFRNFGSKEAVLFTDIIDFPARVRDALIARPADEDLLDSIAAVTLELGQRTVFDPERELLRSALAESTPAIRAQALLYRDDLIQGLAQAISERVDLSITKDHRPYVAATMWVASFEWYRKSVIESGKRPPSAERAVAEIVELLRPSWPQLPAKKEPARRVIAKPQPARVKSASKRG
jgi:AcrR family transcriptional regulator